MDTIELIVFRMIARQFHKNVEEINESMNFIEDLGADSIDLVELIMFCEDEFKIELDVSEYESVKRIKDLIDLIEKKKP